MKKETRNIRGIPTSELAKAVLPAIANDEYEIPVGEAKDLVLGASTNFNQAFNNINQW